MYKRRRRKGTRAWIRCKHGEERWDWDWKVWRMLDYVNVWDEMEVRSGSQS